MQDYRPVLKGEGGVAEIAGAAPQLDVAIHGNTTFYVAEKRIYLLHQPFPRRYDLDGHPFDRDGFFFVGGYNICLVDLQ